MLNKFEIFTLIDSSGPVLKHIIKIHQFDIFAWLMANLIISFLTTFWIQLFIPDVHISSKELLNTSFVIFVNASLFSIIPNVIVNADQQEDNNDTKIDLLKSISDLLKYFNVFSTTVAIIIPFVYTTLNFSFTANFIIATILLVLSFFHFLIQHCYQEVKTNPNLILNRKIIAKNNEKLPGESQHGGRVG